MHALSGARVIRTLIRAKLPCLALLAVAAFAQLPAPVRYPDVPYVPTSQAVVDAMLKLAGVHSGDVLVDLGSGDGRLPITAAKRYGIRATGVEIDPEWIRTSIGLAKAAGVADKIEFIQGDLFDYDLRSASVVTIFLLPGINERLKPKLLAELKPGSRIVSHRFDMGTWAPDKTIEVEGERIFLWTVRDKAAAERDPEPIPAKPFSQLRSLFAYDPSVDLHVRMESAEQTIFRVENLSYGGSHGPVSATIVSPLRPGKHAVVIFMHDAARKRDEFMAEAAVLAQANPPLVSLLLDAPASRQVGWRRSFNPMAEDNDRNVEIQAVIDIRRGIDVLISREDVDPARIGYVGHGYGATWGAILSSIDPRLKAFVLIGGIPSLTAFLSGDDPESADLRYAMGKENFSRYLASLADLDAIHYLAQPSGYPILLQYGRFDPYVSRALADRFADATPPPKRVVFYDSGHAVNDPRGIADRDAFIERELNRKK